MAKEDFISWIFGILAAYYAVTIFVKTVESGILKEIAIVLILAYIVYDSKKK